MEVIGTEEDPPRDDLSQHINLAGYQDDEMF